MSAISSGQAPNRRLRRQRKAALRKVLRQAGVPLPPALRKVRRSTRLDRLSKGTGSLAATGETKQLGYENERPIEVGATQ